MFKSVQRFFMCHPTFFMCHSLLTNFVFLVSMKRTGENRENCNILCYFGYDEHQCKCTMKSIFRAKPVNPVRLFFG